MPGENLKRQGGMELPESVEPLSGIYPEKTADVMKTAAGKLNLPVRTADAGTQLYLGGNPEKPGQKVPDGDKWIEIRGKRYKDYTALWEKVAEMQRTLS
jgi:hypothetical protein